MVRMLLLLSVLALFGCAGQQFSGYPIPLYPPSGASLGYPTVGPVPLHSPMALDQGPIEPVSESPAIEQPDVTQPAPLALGLVSPPGNHVLPATEGPGSEASIKPPETVPVAEPPAAEKAPSPANPQAEAPAPSRLTTEGSEGPDEEPDVAQRLQEIKKQLDAQNGQVPPGSLVPQATAGPQPASSWLPTRPGFHDHYGGLNHSGDVPARP
jgi:hypothetical protein